ncbi:hypothetical protein ACXYMU_09940 [Pontibacter sp. CAU 1760]
MYKTVGRDWDYFQVLKWRDFQAFKGLEGIKGHQSGQAPEKEARA